jgi:hypothetical protein
MSRANGDMGDARFQVSAPQVIHETIDGEVIIINLATGTYYSLKGSGAEIWQLIQQPSGITGSDLVDALGARFRATRGELEAALELFLAELRNEGLVALAEESSGSVHIVEPSRSKDHENGVPAFTSPTLEKFTDMQDLVLLDPVHEVAETGWPLRRDGIDAKPAA